MYTKVFSEPTLRAGVPQSRRSTRTVSIHGTSFQENGTCNACYSFACAPNEWNHSPSSVKERRGIATDMSISSSSAAELCSGRPSWTRSAALIDGASQELP